MATPFDPLANIVTPQQLLLQRAQDWNDQYLNDRKLAQNGQQAGFASLGTAIGQGLSAITGDNDPLMQKAKQNAQILTQANADAANISDPYEKQAAVLKTASNAFRKIGAFDTSAQLDANLLQLMQQKGELSKLNADAASAQSTADKNAALLPGAAALQTAQTAEAGAKAGEALSTIPLNQAKLNNEQAAKPASFYKMVNGQPDIVGVDLRDDAAVKQAVSNGYKPLNISMQVAKPGDLATDNTKTTDTSLQKEIIDARNQLDSLGQVAQKFDPKFLELPTQLLMKGASAADSLGVKLTPAMHAQLDDYTSFRRDSVDQLNRYIKLITGAQMSAAEADRLRKAIPDPERDSPTQFASKLRGSVRAVMQIDRRASEALNSGLQVQGDQWNRIAYPQVNEADVDAFLGQAHSSAPVKAHEVQSQTDRQNAASGAPPTDTAAYLEWVRQGNYRQRQ